MYEDKKRYLSSYMLQKSRIDRLKEMIISQPERQKEFLAQINAANELRDTIEKKIQEVDGGTLTEILYWKYVCGKSLWGISEYINYCFRHTERLHLKALEKFKL